MFANIADGGGGPGKMRGFFAALRMTTITGAGYS